MRKFAEHDRDPDTHKELFLHLAADDKPGIAYQIGVLCAMADADVLRHARLVVGTGMSNVLVAKFVDAMHAAGHATSGVGNADVWARLVHNSPHEVPEHADDKRDRTPTANRDKDGDGDGNDDGAHAQPAAFTALVLHPVIRWLQADQERWVMMHHLRRPWQWFSPWGERFVDCLGASLLPNLVAGARRAAVDRVRDTTAPIFVMNAKELYTDFVYSVTTDTRPPVGDGGGAQPHLGVMPRMHSVFDIDRDGGQLLRFVAASSHPGGFCEATDVYSRRFEPSTRIDPLGLQPAAAYFDVHRGPSLSTASSDRAVVVDAYHDGTLDSYQRLILARDRTACRVTPVRKRDDGPLTRLALHDGLYLEMYADGADPTAVRTPARARGCRTPDRTPNMCALPVGILKACIQHGYGQATRFLGKEASHPARPASMVAMSVPMSTLPARAADRDGTTSRLVVSTRVDGDEDVDAI